MNDRDSIQLAPGTRLGAYEIIGPLGAGGMGEVYRARDARLAREVAIKVLSRETAADETARRRLMREARTAAQLNHPHICTIYDVGEAEGLAYIAMEYVDGSPLDVLIGAGGLPLDTVARTGAQIADALAYAHERGVVHRDLKCANVLVTSDGRAKVLDFGLATLTASAAGDEGGAAEQTRTLTHAGAIVGTPQYLAPEVLRGGVADARSDVWSLGVMLYEMASGARPFRGASVIELGAAILNEPPGPLPARVPPALAAIVDRCLEKDPAQRFQRAADVRAALAGLEAGGRVPRARPRARLWIAVAAVAAALVLLAAAAVLDVAGLRSRLLGGRGGRPIASLAVLPLTNFSRDPEQQYFTDGMTEELITSLAQIPTVRVISRTSVMGFKDTTLPLREIARKLGVDAVVEGSVQRSGNRVRITAQLIRAANDEHMWAQTYERDVSDVLALQDEVAGAIAKEVQGRLAPRPSRAAAATRAASTRSYDLYLRALDATRHWEKQSDRAALAFLNQALAEDSTYAPAWAAIGLVYLDEPGQFGTRDEDVAHARRVVERALALDPNLGLAHSVMGQIEFQQDWNWPAAERELQRAIRLSPSLFEAHHLYSHLLMATGRVDESLRESRAALAVDPLNTDAVLHMGWYDYVTGQYGQAIDQFEATLRLDPSFQEAYRFLASTYVLTGRYDDAEAAQRKALEITGSSDTTSTVVTMRSRLALNGVIAARRGRTDEALRIVSKMIEDADRGEGPAYDVATIFAQLGRKDDAFRWLDRSFRSHEEYLIGLNRDPFLAPLSSDPRYAELLRRIGLAA